MSRRADVSNRCTAVITENRKPRCTMARMAWTKRRALLTTALVLLLAGGACFTVPYVRAASLFIRVANVGGRLEALANRSARTITLHEPRTIPTRHGDVPAQIYE